MAMNNSNKSVENDEESLLSHNFNTTSNKIANAQVREVMKDNVFPKAKFLRLEDMPYSNNPSWCHKMVK